MKVANDVRDGIVSIRTARDVYAVAVDTAGVLDPAATARLRA